MMFHTINYKGFYIHTHVDDNNVEQVQVRGKPYKSLHAAKCAITRTLIPAHNAAMHRLLVEIV